MNHINYNYYNYYNKYKKYKNKYKKRIGCGSDLVVEEDDKITFSIHGFDGKSLMFVYQILLK